MELSTHATRLMLNYSTLDLARKHLRYCLILSSLTLALPFPLLGGAVYGFFHFQPTWFTDVFLWAILVLFAVGQIGAFIQLISLIRGATKAKKTLSILRSAGERPSLGSLQDKLMNKAPSCSLRDSVLRWIQLGVQGETQGIERMMEHASVRREQKANTIISFHTLINRVTLKMGFLGTLIGLLMTFEPMKQAMLSLQGSEGEFRFIQDIVKAIDGDAYAILTTLFATGLSLFVELLTIQIFERILDQFEMVNNNLDDWCLIHLQPWINDNYGGRRKTENSQVEELQQQFSQKMLELQSTMDEQLRALSERVQETGRQMLRLAPLQKEIDRKIGMLADYEQQYRQFISTKLRSLAPAVAKTEKKHE
jgi:biopolymer transport protein ExbB/TolQ